MEQPEAGGLSVKIDLPLKDGQEFVDAQGRFQKVMGEIREPGSESICWTLLGGWFRRSDAEPMTGAARDELGNPVTIREFYRRKAEKYGKNQ